MIEELEVAFAVDAVELGLLASAYFVTSISLQVPVGWLLDRFGPRSVLVTSMVLGAVGLIWFGYASTLDSAIWARVLLGVAGAPAFASAALVASRRFRATVSTLAAQATTTAAPTAARIATSELSSSFCC